MRKSLVFLPILAVLSQLSPGADDIRSSFNNVAYFANWGIYQRNYQPLDLPSEVLTHVLYSFANIGEDGTVYLTDPYADLEKHYETDSWNEVGTNVYGCIKQLYLIKKNAPRLKVLLSIGGWTYSSNFPRPASTDTGRRQFAKSAVELVKDLGFDGVDIDWEYPKDATEAKNFVLLLEATREALDNYTAQQSGPRQILSVAIPAGPTQYKTLDLQGMVKYVDMWNLMAYDYMGSFSNRAGHQANLFPTVSSDFNSNQAIEHYIASGVPSKRINLGMPLYGRAFAETDGLGKPFNGVGKGDWEPGVWDYKNLPQPGAKASVELQAAAAYSYDASRKLFISYESPQTLKLKTDYIIAHQLGGAMFWEASGDGTGDKSLLRIAHDNLEAAGEIDSSRNSLVYADSKYQNLRNGMP